jgi:hypothetical protein
LLSEVCIKRGVLIVPLLIYFVGAAGGGGMGGPCIVETPFGVPVTGIGAACLKKNSHPRVPMINAATTITITAVAGLSSPFIS